MLEFPLVYFNAGHQTHSNLCLVLMEVKTLSGSNIVLDICDIWHWRCWELLCTANHRTSYEIHHNKHRHSHAFMNGYRFLGVSFKQQYTINNYLLHWCKVKLCKLGDFDAIFSKPWLRNIKIQCKCLELRESRFIWAAWCTLSVYKKCTKVYSLWQK